MDWDLFFDALAQRASKFGKAAASATLSVVGPFLLLMVAHFVGYLSSFGADIAQLLDIGAVVRFSFSAFLFFGVIISMCRLTVFVICAAFSSEILNRFLISVSNFAVSKLGETISGAFSSPRDLAVAVLGYVLGFVVFSLFYLGGFGAVIFLVFFIIFQLLVFGFITVRQAVVGEQLSENFSGEAIVKLLPLIIVIFAFVSGELRGEYVFKSKNFLITRNSSFKSCPSLAEDKIEGGSLQERKVVTEYPFFIEGPIVLVTNSGFVFIDRNSQNVWFISWESGYMICSDQRYNLPFKISRIPAAIFDFFGQ